VLYAGALAYALALASYICIARLSILQASSPQAAALVISLVDVIEHKRNMYPDALVFSFEESLGICVTLHSQSTVPFHWNLGMHWHVILMAVNRTEQGLHSLICRTSYARSEVFWI
jgi:hypothetical protein